MSERRLQLLRLVHRFYPANLAVDDPLYAEAEETKRLRQAQEQARTDRSRLISLMDAMEAESAVGRVLDMSYLAYDAGYTLRLNADPVHEASTRWREIVVCISTIAPVYLLYQALIEISPSGEQRISTMYSPDPDLVPLWRKTAHQVEQVFGYSLLEADDGLQIVPDIEVQNVPQGKATLYDLLFTPTRE